MYALVYGVRTAVPKIQRTAAAYHLGIILKTLLSCVPL